MKKQLFITLLALLVSMSVRAYDFEINGIYYNITSSVAPYTVAVTYGGQFSGPYYMGSITIPETVTYSGKTYNVISIGEYAFYSCSGLTSVIIPNSITSIGSYAFCECDGLTSVTIPESVTAIGYGAFYYCTSLECIVVEAGNTMYDSRNNCNAIIEMSSNTLIIGCKNTTIPNSVTSIGTCAFSGCYGLTSVTIPEGVTSIGEYAFEDCKLRNLSVRRETPPSSYTSSFSEQTQYHTMLYIPVGTWDAYAYDDAWYKFINIRETAMESNNVAPENAYTLMNAKDFTYAVYDPVNDCVGTVSSVGVNEDNPNHCWQTVEVSGKQFLYNIGAKKFAVPATDGSSFTLSDTVGSVEMTDGTDGIVLNGHTETQWALVLNESMNTDNSVEDVIVTAIENITDNGNAHDSPIYDLNGREVTKPTKGVYIKNGKKVLIR